MDNKETKQLFVEQLKKTPIIQVCCEKLSLSRSSIYRWFGEDKVFKETAEKARSEGRVLVSEVAESKLMNAIKSENLGAIKFWLCNNDPRYSNKLELKGQVAVTSQELTPAQEKSIKKALLLSEPEKGGSNGK